MLCSHCLGFPARLCRMIYANNRSSFSSKRIETQIQDAEGETDKKRTEVYTYAITCDSYTGKGDESANGVYRSCKSKPRLSNKQPLLHLPRHEKLRNCEIRLVPRKKKSFQLWEVTV